MVYSVLLPQVPPNARAMPPHIPKTSHRHASPAGPWPWADLVEEPRDKRKKTEDDEQRNKDLQSAAGTVWSTYPGKSFSNWNRSRLERSGIAKILKDQNSPDLSACTIYHIDVGQDGQFSEPQQHVVEKANKESFWDFVQHGRLDHLGVRALFVENLSGSVLQMLGFKYTIEPFFFSSSLNWIPSRYQEDIHQHLSDHITITLIFLRTTADPTTVPTPGDDYDPATQPFSRVGTATFDTQAPLSLRSSDRMLLLDLLAFHMVRNENGGTIISYHPPSEWQTTSANYFHSRVRFAGQSVYWGNIFRQSEDPTFLLLCMLWYALYAWDESLDNLYNHICWLESRVLITNDIYLTRELHIIRASLLYYTSLLDDFRKSVVFIQNTPNPAIRGEEAERSGVLMNRECKTLLSEIERLEMFRQMQGMRLENVMNLAFSSVNLQDSRDMQRLTQAALRDSAVMKQISYLTMIFLPASFVASAFGMNIGALAPDTRGTLAHYMAAALPLTAMTVWVIMALHDKARHEEPERGFIDRLRWPIRSIQRILGRSRRKDVNKLV